ncbi:MAG TPA: hypothetical protein VMS96_09730 [Terriglobales bacterium]|nr:hypothetical protein [Terriglobales bacterium]
MLRQSYVRVVLAAMLMVLLLAPMAAAFAAVAEQQHGCCKDAATQVAQRNPQQCCVMSSNPGPSPAAIAPPRAAGHERVLVGASRVAVPRPQTSEYLPASELTPSPPIGPNCSSILRI